MLAGSDKIIIIDSSDSNLRSPNLQTIHSVEYVVTEVRSAANQRNIGLNLIDSSDYVFFLDDDVVPPKNYFTECISTLNTTGAVGVSGVALNPNTQNNFQRKKSFLHKIFLLDSSIPGTLLKSGVNVPVRIMESGIVKVDWLIGCSAWAFKEIGSTRFESDFHGQSVGEDVIFSVRMRKKGCLVTNSDILLMHLESNIERPTKKEFWQMWVQNRARLIEVARFGPFGKLSFWWANLGQLLILIYLKVTRKSYIKGSMRGLLQGFALVLKHKK
jgi:GT2 family glycosyltransferase